MGFLEYCMLSYKIPWTSAKVPSNPDDTKRNCAAALATLCQLLLSACPTATVTRLKPAGVVNMHTKILILAASDCPSWPLIISEGHCFLELIIQLRISSALGIDPWFPCSVLTECTTLPTVQEDGWASVADHDSVGFPSLKHCFNKSGECVTICLCLYMDFQFEVTYLIAT